MERNYEGVMAGNSCIPIHRGKGRRKKERGHGEIETRQTILLHAESLEETGLSTRELATGEGGATRQKKGLGRLVVRRGNGNTIFRKARKKTASRKKNVSIS